MNQPIFHLGPEQPSPEQRLLLLDLVLNGEKHALTPKGEQAGVEFVAKFRFGPYFLWPQGIIPN